MSIARPPMGGSGARPRGRPAVACGLLAAQLWVGACASVAPTSRASKRDLVSVAFAEPRVVSSAAGRDHALHSLIGQVERVSADTVFLRIADATAVDGAPTETLLGRRVALPRNDGVRLTVLDEDTSGVTMAATLVVTLGAFVAGVLLGTFGLGYE